MIRGDFLEKIKFEMNIQEQVGVPKQKRRKRSFSQVKRRDWKNGWEKRQERQKEADDTLLCKSC